MNLLELRNWLALQTIAPYANEQIDGYINQAYLELAAAYEWPWLETTTSFDFEAGTTEYPLPADINRLTAVIYSAQGAEAQPKRTTLHAVLARLGNDVGESDLPTDYYLRGSNLVFVPTPSSTQEVTLAYLARPTLLAGDEDEPLFDAAFHIYLAQAAAALYFESEDSFEQAGYYHAMASDTFARLVRFYDLLMPTEQPFILGGGVWRPRPKPFTDWPS